MHYHSFINFLEPV